MRTSGDLVRRPSTRWRDFDYATEASYFVTICSFERACTFGRVVDDEVELSPLGLLVLDQWLATPALRPGVILDSFVIMPNHFHGTLFLPTSVDVGHSPQFGMRLKRSLGSTLGGFKSKVTSLARVAASCPKLTVWQERFHDEVIRDTRHLEAVRQYIADNPRNWNSDEFYRES